MPKTALVLLVASLCAGAAAEVIGKATVRPGSTHIRAPGQPGQVLRRVYRGEVLDVVRKDSLHVWVLDGEGYLFLWEVDYAPAPGKPIASSPGDMAPQPVPVARRPVPGEGGYVLAAVWRKPVVALTVDAKGSVYLLLNDREARSYRVEKLAGDGKVLAALGPYKLGDGPGEIQEPRGIAVDASGSVYVLNGQRCHVQKYAPDGTFVRNIGARGAAEGQFTRPTGIAVDAKGDLYVADTSQPSIQKLTGDGSFLARWGGRGRKDGQFLTISGLAVDAKGNICVCDGADPPRIQKFAADGKLLAKWGAQGPGGGLLLSPRKLAADVAGCLYVVDRFGVLKFAADGKFLTKWGGRGPGSIRVAEGADIAVSPDGTVYMTYGSSVQVLRPAGKKR
jgi:hypothetical protein